MTKTHVGPDKEVNVAVPTEELDGVTGIPLMVNSVVTDNPRPPDQVTVNPVVELAVLVTFVTGVGNPYAGVVTIVFIPVGAAVPITYGIMLYVYAVN